MPDFRNLKPMLSVAGLALVLTLGVYGVSLFWPKYEERFFEMGLLGSSGRAGDYYLRNSSNVEVGSNVTWLMYIHNHMGSARNILVRVKLLNATMQAPNDYTHEPSPHPFFMEIPFSMSIDETLFVPFSWLITEASLHNDSIVIRRLVVNGESFDVGVSSRHDSRFRTVFELWVYDESSREYTYSWDSGKGFCSISLYLWFNLTSP